MPIRSRALHPKPYALLPILLACLLACAPSTGQPVSRRPPNIVFLLTDDQGYGDLSCTGNPTLRTPNMDRLHDEGVRFTDFHVSPTCSPTRSALMTGRHEFRSGVTRTILERERMALSAVTNAQVLKRAGYATGIFGKWHLGDEDAYQPGRRGFDEVFIHGGGGIGQTYEGSCGDAPGNTYFDPAILHNGRFERTHGYCTDVFYGQAIRWMDRMRTRRRPFFAYVPCNAPHEPLQVRPEDGARYSGRVADRRVARYFGMIANIDDNVGRLLAKLHDWGIERDTLVLFMNDNGGTFGVPVFNAGMRGGKVTAFLGGTRAASFWRWPGTLKPADVDALAAHIDVFPRLAEIAGVRLSPKEAAQVEGRSLVPLLANPAAPWPERTLFTHVGRWPKGAPPSAYKYANGSVRTPRWHLVSASTGAARNWMLFDVRADPGEQTDVALENPSVVREMDALFDRWWLSVQPFLVNEDAVGPPVNPFKARYRKQFADLTPRPPSGDGKGEPSRGDTDGRDKEHAPGVDSPRAAASPDLVPDRPSGTEREQLSRAAGGQDAEPAPRQSSRRTPSPSGGATAGATVSVHAIVQSPPHPIVKRPNVLFVIADQWRQSAFGFAGNGDVRTPNLDRFAAQSVRFSNAVSTIPVCSPTRATILTGQRALTHGVFMNDVPLSPAAVTLPKIL
ncbi:MAG TPA: sulfatase-like hydrolase/transferase, partial [Chthonomonadaceae bacterium]|nr:sulfatase-like hydrolase/transferase [Chthonomonadaceae bacterium]